MAKNNTTISAEKVRSLIQNKSRRRYKAVLIGSFACLLTIIISAILLIAFFVQTNFNNESALDNPAFDKNIKLVIDDTLNSNYNNPQKWTFNLPARSNLTSYMDLDEVNKNINKALSSEFFITKVTTNSAARKSLSNLLATRGYGLQNDQDPSSGYINITHDGTNEFLSLRATGLNIPYASDSYGDHSRFGVVSIKKQSTYLQLSFKFAIAFLESATVSQAPKTIGITRVYEHTLSSEFNNPSALLPYIDNLKYLNAPTVTSSDSWQQAVAQIIFNYFYTYRAGITRLSQNSIFTGGVHQISYDNRVINPATQLNSNMFVLRFDRAQNYKYASEVLARLFMIYNKELTNNSGTLRFENVGTLNPRDNYSGYVPGQQDGTDGKDQWGSAKTTFDGRINVKFAGMTVASNVQFQYTQTSYANSTKRVKLPDLGLNVYAKNLLKKADFDHPPTDSDFNVVKGKLQEYLTRWIASNKILAGHSLNINTFSYDYNVITSAQQRGVPRKNKAGTECTQEITKTYYMSIVISARIPDFSTDLTQQGSADRLVSEVTEFKPDASGKCIRPNILKYNN